ncbi:MAG: dynamin family protein [Synergistales bacterium]|nr:dynamin family protein [Synergistales bacterium]
MKIKSTSSSTFSSVNSDLLSLISKTSEKVQSLAPELNEIASKLMDLGDRLQADCLHLAILGQFKRGKSTLLNALLGEDILPTGVIPLTAIPTFLKHGNERQAVVYFREKGAPQTFNVADQKILNSILTKYITETGNPRNYLGVSHMELSLPAPILKQGLVFIDTPGIGSTFRHNTEATLNFLPQCDAAMFLISADPPISEVEIEFLKEVRKKVPKLFFILNKMDYLTAEDQEEALQFFKCMLVEQAGITTMDTVFCVSAKNGLTARSLRNEQLWKASGLSKVENHLVEFLAREKSLALQKALEIKTRDLIVTALTHLRLMRRSLEMPVEELENLLSQFEQALDELKLQRHSAEDLVKGDLKRMLSFLGEHARLLRVEATHYLEGIIWNAPVDPERESFNEADLRSALAEAIPGWFEHQAGVSTELFRKQVTEVLGIHQKRAGDILERIREKASSIFNIPYQPEGKSFSFEVVRKPYWITHQWASTLYPFSTSLKDKVFPRAMRIRRVRDRMSEQISNLVLSNVENLRWACFQSINESFLRFEKTLDEQLSETLKGTQGAIQAVLEERKRRGGAAEEKIANLDRVILELEDIQKELDGS